VRFLSSDTVHSPVWPPAPITKQFERRRPAVFHAPSGRENAFRFKHRSIHQKSIGATTPHPWADIRTFGRVGPKFDTQPKCAAHKTQETTVTYLKTLTTALVGLSLAAAAHADTKTFQAKFEYRKSDPASVTYASLEDQAVRTCSRQSRSMSLAGPSIRYKWNRECADDLLDKAVAAIGSPSLMALHQQSAPPTSSNSQIAAAD
jgi:hypothetical protein